MIKHSLLCLGLALALFTGTALADIGKQQAAEIAQSRFQGRVIAVNEDQYKNRRAYRVKILNKKGDLHIVIVDLQSGDVLAAH